MVHTPIWCAATWRHLKSSFSLLTGSELYLATTNEQLCNMFLCPLRQYDDGANLSERLLENKANQFYRLVSQVTTQYTIFKYKQNICTCDIKIDSIL